MSTPRRWAARWAKRIAKGVGLLVAALLLFVVLFVAAIVVTPAFYLPTSQLEGWIAKYAPKELDLHFSELEIAIQRPKGRWLAKRIVIDAGDFCAQYHGDAVLACLDEFHLALTVSLNGIERIEPIRILGVNANVDLPKFPKSEKKSEEGGFDTIGFLRKQVLPKWDLEDSRIEVEHVAIRTSSQAGYSATFDLGTGVNPGEIEIALHEVRALDGPLFASATATVMRPASWGGARAIKAEANQWKVVLDSVLSLDRTRKFHIVADANITSFKELDTRVRVFLKGIKPLREGRIEAKLDGSKADGVLSLALGAAGAQLRALDFVNCNWKANLDAETGSVHCGPDTVRLVVKEQSFLRRPDLFTFTPQFDLNIKKIYFGDEKGADLDLDLRLDHGQFATLATKVDASFRTGKGPARYSVSGSLDLLLPEFRRFVELMRQTPYSVPAPINTLGGRIALGSTVDFSEKGGSIVYKLSTALDSRHQALHLHLDGQTKLTPRGKSLHPATDATLVVDKIRLAAPRFDLRAPPAMKPDSRFGPIEKPVRVAEQENKSAPMDFKLRIKTAQPEALKIATNLTKSAIPLSMDVLYDGSVRDTVIDEDASRNATAPFKRDVATLARSELEPTAKKKHSPVSGWVTVGRTPVDLFKRNAVLEEMRVDLLESGDNRVNGRVSVSYLEYTIQMLVMGAMREPQVRFFSDPPLDDDQIVAVLLFGRPSHELGEDEKASAASLTAAFSDAVLSVSSLYLLASTPIESVGYDPEKQRVTARVGLGGGTSLELGGGSSEGGSGVGIRKRLSSDFLFRSEVETLGTTGKRTVSALIEWVKKF